MMSLAGHKTNKLYIKYNRSLELAFQVLSSRHAVHFRSVTHLAEYLGCEDNQTALDVLYQLSQRYRLSCAFDDQGIWISNGAAG